MGRLTRNRVTTPPRVLPLILVGFVAMSVAYCALSILAAGVQLVGLPLDDDSWQGVVEIGIGSVALELALDVVLLVGSSLLLRWLVRRWVVVQPPEPPAVR